MFGIKVSSNLGTYLGYSLKPNLKTNDFNFILDKVNARLCGWKTHLLSKIDRTELINSTVSGLTNYYMKPFLLPQKTNNLIDKRVRDFFWGHESNIRKIHTIKWEEIVKPKRLGGSGIRQASHHNKAIRLGTYWRMQKFPFNLCSQFFHSEYGSNLTNKNSLESFKSSSHLL